MNSSKVCEAYFSRLKPQPLSERNRLPASVKKFSSIVEETRRAANAIGTSHGCEASGLSLTLHM